MAFVLKDRIKETSTTSGTGTLTLAGAASGGSAGGWSVYCMDGRKDPGSVV